MKKCWKLPPADRPCFSDLVATLDKTLSSVAGYTELSMTLLEPSRSGESEEWPQYEEVQPPDIEPSELRRHYLNCIDVQLTMFSQTLSMHQMNCESLKYALCIFNNNYFVFSRGRDCS